MSPPLRVLLVGPPVAAADATDRLRARGPVAPARVPTADLLDAALSQPWDALLVLPGSGVPFAAIAAAAAAGTAPPLFVESASRPVGLPGAVHLRPGDTAALLDHLVRSDEPAATAGPGAPPVSAELDPEPAEAAPDAEPALALAADLALTADLALAADDAAAAPETTEQLARDLPIGVYRTTPGGRILFGNAACARILGLGSERALADLDIQDLDYPREHFEALMASDGVVRNLVTTWTRPDGHRLHTRESARAVRDRDGAVRYYEGTLENVTDEVEARRAADRRSRQHQAAARFAAAASAEPRSAVLCEEAVVAAHEALGTAWTLLVRRSGGANDVAAWAGPLTPGAVAALAASADFAALPLDAVEVAEQAPAFQPLVDVCACHSVVAFPLLHGGQSLGAIVAAYEDEPPGADDLRTGEELAWHLAGHLARLRAERDLADSEATLRYVAAHADAVLFRQRADGTYDYLSPGIERLTGLGPERVADLGGLDALATAREVLQGAPDGPPGADAETLHVRYTVPHFGGGVRVVDTRARPWCAADGAPIGWVGAYTDVTDEVEAAASLRDARDRAVEAAEVARQEALHRSEALAEVSHEIRTPLTSVLGYAEILAGELDGAHRELAETLVKSGQAILRTINVVLDQARLASEGARPRLAPADLGAAVAAAAEPLRSLAVGKGLAFEVDAAPGLVVALDADALGRIVTNLVGNAVKYTEAGTIGVAVRADGDEAILHVTDTGVGIPGPVREHLFEPFQTGAPATPNSSGLGLSIVKRLADSLGGTISVEDRAPGTDVSIRFARFHPHAAPSAHPVPDPMTHPLPTSGDGQPDAPHAPLPGEAPAASAPHPPAPHGDGHAAFVARPQPPAGHPAPAAGYGAAPGAGYGPPSEAGFGAAYAPAPHAPASPPAPPQAPPAYPAPPHGAYAPAAGPQGTQESYGAPLQGAPAPPSMPAPPSGYAPPMPAPPSGAPPMQSAPAPVAPAPVAPAPAAAAPPTPAPADAAPAGDKARILVVEDNNDTRMLLDRILRRTYDVTAVGDARSALVAMHTTRFDGLVLDINLGGKETGADILRIARSLDGYQGVFAIALTAYALPGDRERLLEKGFSEYISKPFTRSSLMDALAKGITV